jgi:SAM-dependent methyltransferase
MPLLPDVAAYHAWAAQLDRTWLADAESAAPDDAWLLRQTAYTGPGRRQALAGLPLITADQPMPHWADLGCGFGAAVLELAQMVTGTIDGWDTHPARIARAIAQQGREHLTPTTAFYVGDVTRQRPAHAYDGAIARFLVQHLPDPANTLAHWRTHWVRPGGWLWIEDVDDGWTVESPPVPSAWQTVLTAFRQAQAAYGGDRHIGRRLPALLIEAGWQVTQIQVVPQTFWGRLTWDDPSVQFEVARVASLRSAMHAHGLSDAAYAAGLAALQAHYPQTVLVTNATVRILARSIA